MPPSTNFSRRAFSTLSSKKPSLHGLLQSASYSTASAKHIPSNSVSEREPEATATHRLQQSPVQVSPSLSRPAEIPWQPKISNSVRLIGSVGLPVHMEAAPDGKYWAATVLVQQKAKHAPRTRIPLLFEGDLAQIAACHLKEKDLICVTGQLSGDSPPVSFENCLSKIQVVVQNVNYVQMIKTESPAITNKQTLIIPATKSGRTKDTLWEDLITNPKQWRDYRTAKLNGLFSPEAPDFKHKEARKCLWISSAPKRVLSKVDGLEFDEMKVNSKQELGEVESKFKKRNSEKLWMDLVENPDEWWDYRAKKCNDKYPDFRHKKTGDVLWLRSSPPSWVLSKLPPSDSCEIDVQH